MRDESFDWHVQYHGHGIDNGMYGRGEMEYMFVVSCFASHNIMHNDDLLTDFDSLFIPRRWVCPCPKMPPFQRSIHGENH